MTSTNAPKATPMNGLALAALAVVTLHLVLRLAGAADHTSVIAGMPQSPLSIVVGPLYVLTALASTIVAPIVFLAFVLEAGARSLSSRPR
jgi:hypothetical protein